MQVKNINFLNRILFKNSIYVKLKYKNSSNRLFYTSKFNLKKTIKHLQKLNNKSYFIKPFLRRYKKKKKNKKLNFLYFKTYIYSKKNLIFYKKKFISLLKIFKFSKLKKKNDISKYIFIFKKTHKSTTQQV